MATYRSVTLLDFIFLQQENCSTDEFTRVLVPVIYKGLGHMVALQCTADIKQMGVHLELTKVICKSNQSAEIFGEVMNCP